MRNLLDVFILLLMFVLVGLFVKINCDFEDFKKQADYEAYKSEKRIAELEKDIRILQMDSYINTNGFEGGEQ